MWKIKTTLFSRTSAIVGSIPEAGGNSRFAGGVMRFAFDGVDDLRKVADLTDEEIAAPTSAPIRAPSTSTTSSA
jgi:hypothetical protein